MGTKTLARSCISTLHAIFWARILLHFAYSLRVYVRLNFKTIISLAKEISKQHKIEYAV